MRARIPVSSRLRRALEIHSHCNRRSLEDTGMRARCLGQHDTVSAARPAMQCLDRYLSQYLPTEVEDIKPDTPVFWSTFGQRRQGTVRRPMEGKNIWRLCKTYGRLI